jgi:hypothetical protein
VLSIALQIGDEAIDRIGGLDVLGVDLAQMGYGCVEIAVPEQAQKRFEHLVADVAVIQRKAQHLLALLDDVVPAEDELQRPLPGERLQEEVLQMALAIDEEHPIRSELLVGHEKGHDEQASRHQSSAGEHLSLGSYHHVRHCGVDTLLLLHARWLRRCLSHPTDGPLRVPGVRDVPSVSWPRHHPWTR